MFNADMHAPLRWRLRAASIGAGALILAVGPTAIHWAPSAMAATQTCTTTPVSKADQDAAKQALQQAADANKKAIDAATQAAKQAADALDQTTKAGIDANVKALHDAADQAQHTADANKGNQQYQDAAKAAKAAADQAAQQAGPLKQQADATAKTTKDQADADNKAQKAAIDQQLPIDIANIATSTQTCVTDNSSTPPVVTPPAGSSNGPGSNPGNGNPDPGQTNNGSHGSGSNAGGNGGGSDNSGSGNSNAGGNGGGSDNSGSGSNNGDNGNHGQGNNGNGNGGSGQNNGNQGQGSNGNGNAGGATGQDNGKGNGGQNNGNHGQGNNGNGNGQGQGNDVFPVSTVVFGDVAPSSTSVISTGVTTPSTSVTLGQLFLVPTAIAGAPSVGTHVLGEKFTDAPTAGTWTPSAPLTQKQIVQSFGKNKSPRVKAAPEKFTGTAAGSSVSWNKQGGAIPLLALLLIAEMLVLGRRFGTKVRRTAKPVVVATAAPAGPVQASWA